MLLRLLETAAKPVAHLQIAPHQLTLKTNVPRALQHEPRLVQLAHGHQSLRQQFANDDKLLGVMNLLAHFVEAVSDSSNILQSALLGQLDSLQYEWEALLREFEPSLVVLGMGLVCEHRLRLQTRHQEM